MDFFLPWRGEKKRQLFVVNSTTQAINFKKNLRMQKFLNATLRTRGDIPKGRKPLHSGGGWLPLILSSLCGPTVFRDSTSFPEGYGVGVEEGERTDVSVLHNLPFVIRRYAGILFLFYFNVRSFNLYLKVFVAY